MRALVQESLDAIVVVNHNGHVAWVDRKAEQVFGYGRSELLGRELGILLPSSAHNVHAAYRAAFMESPHARRMGTGLEIRARRRDGTTFPVEIALIPLYADSDALAIAVVRDISEHQAVVDQQAALRRVATLVARGAQPDAVFAAVTSEVGKLLDVDFTSLSRFRSDGAITVIGGWSRTGTLLTSVGTTLPAGGENIHTQVFRTRQPARFDRIRGDVGAAVAPALAAGVRAAVGAPINVEGQLWGLIIASSTREEPLSAGAEAHLVGFTQLVATAIANAEARLELRRFADEQVALRRVATLAALGVPPEEVFTAVTEEVGKALGSDFVGMSRYNGDGTATVMGEWSRNDVPPPVPIGERFDLGGQNVTTLVAETGVPARIDDYDATSGTWGDAARVWGFRSCVGVPIIVEDRPWGVVSVASGTEILPEDTKARLDGFTASVATAIANAQARIYLATFADEQAALRRVATLVAQGVPPPAVFAAVVEEVGQVLGTDSASMGRYEPDGGITVVGTWGRSGVHPFLSVGTRLPFGGRNIHSQVFQTCQPARLDRWGEDAGPALVPALAAGVRVSVGAPITVEGQLWGVILSSSSHEEPLPADTEARLAGFTELVGTTIANAEAQAALAASRKRLVSTADATRRRIERDLHDGTQQRLVSLGLQLRAAQAMVSPDAAELAALLERSIIDLHQALDELQEVARGIHPAALVKGGLKPALKVLAQRSGLPIALEVPLEGRLPESLEVATYYVVSEALTNAAKHAAASRVEVRVEASENALRIAVSDDGRGGATLDRGSGLVGLKDRVEALGGHFLMRSPPGSGTAVAVVLPLAEDGETSAPRGDAGPWEGVQRSADPKPTASEGSDQTKPPP
jgi:PAS domain S-box-containing protein